MGFLRNIFSKKKRAESVVLVDIGAESVAYAYARYEEGTTPQILHVERCAIDLHEGEAHERAMLRTLRDLGTSFIRTGAPILARAVGSGTAHMVVVSIDEPWQETMVRTEDFDGGTGEKPFLFTRGLVSERLAKSSPASPEKVIADESVIGTILNGYETSAPYGKEAHRVSIVVLSSLINRAVAGGVIATLRGLFHTKNILPIAGSSLRYQAMRALFPHEHDLLVLDATGGSLLGVALVRKGVFIKMLHVAHADGQEWLTAVTKGLADIAKEYPLPRTIFLLAREEDMKAYQEALGVVKPDSLWLSDAPPTIVPVLANTTSSAVRQTSTRPVDIILLLMAVYYQVRDRG